MNSRRTDRSGSDRAKIVWPGVRELAVAVLVVASSAASPAAQTLTFSDQTSAAGLTMSHTPPQGIPSNPMLAGVAVADFDDDGWTDVFVTMGGGVPDRLYVNDGDGTFTEDGANRGVDHMHVGGGSAVGDYDNDGALDLYVTSHGVAPILGPGAHRLYHNEGDGTFCEVAATAGVDYASPMIADGFGAAFGDSDLDGDLDLAVAGWVTNSQGNRLFRNDGDGTFTDVTAMAIPTGLAGVHGFTPRLVDMDGDRYPELLLAADFGTSRYLINDGDGTFTDGTVASGTSQETNGMGQTVGDFDGDGLLDWYVTSIFADGGPGTGNMLYRNQGGHVYLEQSVAWGVKDGGWGWGTVAADFDQDGRLDIAETNGWPSAEWVNEQLYLWINGGAGSFTESAVACNLVHGASVGHGLVHFDADNDGDQDLVVVGNSGPFQYFRNDLSGSSTHWLVVRLDDGDQPGVAPDGYGSTVHVFAGGRAQMRAVAGGGSYLSSSAVDAHFGLGAVTVADEVTVRWPDGTVRQLDDVAADQVVDVVCCGGWKLLGAPLAGTSGAPELQADGTLEGGDVFTLTLSDALPGATAYFVLGLSRVDAPFKAGVMVPSPDVVVPVTIDGAGGLMLPFPWPVGLPAGFPLYMQFWVVDAGGPFGFASSAGLSATTP